MYDDKHVSEKACLSHGESGTSSSGHISISINMQENLFVYLETFDTLTVTPKLV